MVQFASYRYDAFNRRVFHLVQNSGSLDDEKTYFYAPVAPAQGPAARPRAWAR